MTAARLTNDADVEAGEALPVRNPRTGRADYMYMVHPPAPAEITGFCARLREAQTAWNEAGIGHRVAVLRRWMDSLREDAS